MEYRDIVYRCRDFEQMTALLNENSIINALEENDNGVFLHIYVNSEESLPAFIEQISAEYHCSKLSDSIINDREYLLNYKKQAKPEITDYFTILPPFIDQSGHKHPLIIDPGLSFGTGSHATTQLMLNSMAKYSFKGETVLDIGCGSCILSIAATLLGAKDVIGIDIDDNSLISCRENASLNNINSIHTIIGDIYGLNPLHQYSIILLNMLKSNFVPFFGDIQPFMKDNAIMILTGFQDDKETMSFVLNHKYIIKEKSFLDDWYCYVLHQ